ncbi:SAM-dependent methyltransferase [Bradyrhizobium sp. RDT10]
MSLDKKYQCLERELTADNPWRLEVIRSKRHTQMLRLSLSRGAHHKCPGSRMSGWRFHGRLAPHRERLDRSTEPTDEEVAPHHVDSSQQFSTVELFDLIVTEFLDCFEDMAEIRAAIRNLVRLLTPDRLPFRIGA